MTLIECRHRYREEVTTLGEERRRFVCLEIELGKDPAVCDHPKLTRIRRTTGELGATGVVHWNLYRCDECATVHAMSRHEPSSPPSQTVAILD